MASLPFFYRGYMNGIIATGIFKWKVRQMNLVAEILYVEDYIALVGKGLLVARFISEGFKDVPFDIRQRTMDNAIGVWMPTLLTQYEIMHEEYTPQELKN